MSRARALLAWLLLAAAQALGQASAPEVRLLFTGDILLSRQVEVELAARKVSPFGALENEFRQAAWIGGNMEGAIGAAADCLPKANPCFATPEAAAQMLRAAGFKTLTIENNHAGDLGVAGRRRTAEALRAAGLPALDFDGSPQFVRIGELTLGVIAINTVRGADDGVRAIPSVGLAQKLRLAGQLANLVVVSIHWGSELVDWPNETQRKQAGWLVAHGADLVVGHHPHVVQAPECVGGSPVFYSLGNHVFDQKYPLTKEGLIADCRVTGGRLSCGGLATHTGPGTAIPAVAVEQPRFGSLAACKPALRAGLQVGETLIRPEAATANGAANGLMLEGWKFIMPFIMQQVIKSKIFLLK